MKSTEFGLEFSRSDSEWGNILSRSAYRENKGLDTEMAKDEMAAIRQNIKHDPEGQYSWFTTLDKWLEIRETTDMPVRHALQLARISFIAMREISVNYVIEDPANIAVAMPAGKAA
jgi:hypothetical protein